jgi:hypothetical protein
LQTAALINNLNCNKQSSMKERSDLIMQTTQFFTWVVTR